MAWNLTTFLALWGSVLATLTFVWNFSRWLSDRPRLSVAVVHRDGPWGDSVSIKIRNRGEKPTTIEEVMLVTFENSVRRFFGDPNYVENTSVKYGDGVKLPAKIQFGEIWEGLCYLGDEMEDPAPPSSETLRRLNAGNLYFRIRCAHTDRLIRGKVVPEPFGMLG